jgi:hypothetical protein
LSEDEEIPTADRELNTVDNSSTPKAAPHELMNTIDILMSEKESLEKKLED